VTLADLLAEPALRLLDQALRAIAASDDGGRIVYANPAFCREFRTRVEDVVGLAAPEYMPEAERSRWIEHAACWRRGEPRPLYSALPNGAGELERYLVVPLPLEDAAGAHLGIIATFVRAGTQAGALASSGDEETTVRVVLKEIASTLSSLLSAAASPDAGLDALRPSVPELAALTEREWAVASRVARGDRTRLIANELGIRENTVRNHLKAIFRKTGVGSQLELIDRVESWRTGQSGRT
jgi:PAS domain S-box-containing protein